MPDILDQMLLITGSLLEPDDDNPTQLRRYVYQRAAKNHGNIPYSKTRDLQRRVWVQTPDPKTPAKLALQSRFRDAVAAYHAIDETTYRALRARGSNRGRTAINQFISEWCSAHPLDVSAILQQQIYLTTTSAAALLPNPATPAPTPTGIAKTNLRRWTD